MDRLSATEPVGPAAEKKPHLLSESKPYVEILSEKYGIDFEDIFKEEHTWSKHTFLSPEELRAHLKAIHDRDYKKNPETHRRLLQSIESKVAEIAPFWYKKRTQLDANPFAYDLHNILRTQHNVREYSGVERTQRGKSPIPGCIAATDSTRVEITDSIQRPYERINTLLTLAPPPKIDTIDDLRSFNLYDESGIDVVYHELLHNEQLKRSGFARFLKMPIDQSKMGILEAQAWQHFGNPLSFNSAHDVANHIALRYHFPRYINKMPQHARPHKGSMNLYAKHYLESDLDGEVQKTLDAMVACDRLYTISWLKSQHDDSFQIHQPISELVYQKDGIKKINAVITNFLKNELHITDDQDVKSALDSLDTIRDAYHHAQRVEMFRVKHAAQEALTYQAAHTKTNDIIQSPQ